MAEIPDLPGRRAWAENANAALAELSIVAEQFIISYKEKGRPNAHGDSPVSERTGQNLRCCMTYGKLTESSGD